MEFSSWDSPCLRGLDVSFGAFLTVPVVLAGTAVEGASAGSGEQLIQGARPALAAHADVIHGGGP